MPESNNDMVSIIIPCRNEAKYISHCIDSLLAVKNDIPVEIIIVDGKSNDETKKIISEKYSSNNNIKLIENAEIITPFGLNTGIKNANGNYIMIASAHSAYPNNYISTLLNEMKELQCDGIGGVMKTEVLNSTKTSEGIRIALTHPFGVGNALFRTGVISPQQVDTVPFGIYKKSFFNDVGLYNTKLIRNHDIELSKRALRKGKKICLTPSVSCTYYARETYKKLAANNFKNGLWNLKTVFITRNFNSLSLRHFIPLLFLLSIILPVIPSMLISFKFMLVSALSVFLYLMFLFKITFITNKKGTDFFHVLYAFITLHISYGAGSAIGLFYFYKIIK